MAKNRIQILTNQQKKQIKQLLDLADNKEDVFTLAELEGFLFGLAITPDLILPSEWLPKTFGGEMANFDSEEQADLLMREIMKAYNAYTRAFHEETLMFPFDMEKLSSKMIDDMQEWSYGLLEALKMRPEIWYIGYDKDYEDAAEDIKDVIISFCILCGMVYPEEGQGLFEEKNGKPIKDEAESLSMILRLLPSAVATLQAHGAQLEEKHQQNMATGHIDLNTRKIKIERNEPCPCGSGKKYKKCCGMN